MSATFAAPAAPLHGGPARNAAVTVKLRRRRKGRDILATGLATFATIVAMGLLAWILVTLFQLGFGTLRLRVFTTITMASGDNGGLSNAIVGSLIQTALGTAIGTPIGMLAGTSLAEYAGRTAFGNAVRFVSDILLSAPSILIGLFIYSVLVAPLLNTSHSFSGIELVGAAQVKANALSPKTSIAN